MIQTDYFDIIYPEESVAAAEKVAAVCDGYYEELCRAFLIEPYQRFPVTITPAVESLNALFSLYPYNHIVLYDTPPERALDMNEETLENVFYHELTHAVTGNIRSSWNRFMSGIFGDIFSATFFASTQFWIEGVAVEAESRGQSGRLHDPFSTLLVSQAKYENRFPSWRDVTGARDIYPGGTDAYIFGALFSRYLCERYGREQYAAYWKSLAIKRKKTKASAKEKNLLAPDIFDALTGKHMKETWDDFKAWIPVPEQVRSGSDFFLTNKIDERRGRQGFSRKNSQLQLFSAIDTAGNGVTWYERKSGGVWFSSFEKGIYGKAKKLFTAAGVSRLSLSDDSRYIAASYLYDKRTVKTALCVYDRERGQLWTLPLHSCREAAFISSSADAFSLACVNTSSTQEAIEIYAFSRKASGGISDYTLVQSIPLADGEYAYTPVAAGENALACIVKRGLQWKIRVYEREETGGAFASYREYGTDKTILHNLHGRKTAGDRQVFTFSYAAMGDVGSMFPCAGLLYLSADGAEKNGRQAEAEICLLTAAVSGGMTDAALLPSALNGAEECLLYVSESYDSWRLMQLAVDSLPARRLQGESPALTAAEKSGWKEDTGLAVLTVGEDGRKLSDQYPRLSYNPFRYAKNGMYVPLLTSVISYDSNLNPSLATSAYFDVNASMGYIGATFLTANPWGDRLLAVSAGSDWEDGGGASLQLSGGSDTFSYRLSGTVIGASSRFLQTTESLALTHSLYGRYGNSVSWGLSGSYLYGYGIDYDSDGSMVLTADKDWAAKGLVHVLFSTVHKRAPGYFQYGGIFFQPFLHFSQTDSQCVNAGASLGARIPGQFPLSFTASLFPNSDYCCQGTVTALVFSHEVQKGLPALYADRVYISTAYSAKIAYSHGKYFDFLQSPSILRNVESSDFSDALQLKAGIMAAVNIGVLSYATFDISTFVQYRLHASAGQKEITGGLLFDFSY